MYNQNPNNSIRQFYQSIKSDNIDSFKDLYSELNHFLYKDQSYKNYVLYALENNSYQVLDFLFSQENIENTNKFIKNTAFLKGNNKTSNFLILLLQSKKFSSTFANLKLYYPQKKLEELFQQDEYNNKSFYYAITKLNETDWISFFNTFQTTIESYLSITPTKNIPNDSPSFIVTKFGKPYHSHLLKHFDISNFYLSDHQGHTPLLFACSEANMEFIRELVLNCNLNFQNVFDNCLYSACFNDDINVLKFLLQYFKDKGFDTHLIFPLNITITEQMEDKTLYLMDSFTHDISEGLLSLSKHFKTKKSLNMFQKMLPLLKESHVSSILHNQSFAAEFISNLFLHASFNEIQEILKNPICLKIFEYLKSSPAICHHIYNSSIVGRKDINLKIDFLLLHFPIINSENSDSYFHGKIYQNELTFKSPKFPQLKLLKNFSLASSLINLPITQIKNLITQTNIDKHFSKDDYLVLYSLGLYKKSLSFMKFIKSTYLSEKPFIKQNSTNINAFIQNNLILLQNNSESSIFSPKFKSKYAEILSFFEETPSNFLSKIAFDSYSRKNVSEKTISFLFNNNEKYVSSFYNSIITFLLQQENIPAEIVQSYSKSSNNISKVCFSKLINFEKVESFSEKNLLRFLELSFFDPSENSILSEIDLINDDDVVFQNINTYENIKKNSIFDIFAEHQIKNIKSKKYHPKIIKHYNLRTWTILFSILDSSNPHKNNFIESFLKMTDFSIPTLTSFTQNVSINNFKRISHHFDLDLNFWNSLNDYYNTKNIEYKFVPRTLFLNYVSNMPNIPNSYMVLVEDYIKLNLIDANFANELLINKINSFKHTTNSTKFIETIIPLCSDDYLLEILNLTVSKLNLDGFKIILKNAPHLATKFKVDLQSIFDNDLQKNHLSQLFVNVLNNHFLENNQIDSILKVFEAIDNRLANSSDPNLAKIYAVIYNFKPVIHVIDNNILSEITNNYFDYMQKLLDKNNLDLLQKDALIKQFTHLFLIFNQTKNELVLEKQHHEKLHLFLNNQKNNQSAIDILQYFREFDLKERISDDHSLIKQKKKI